MKKYIQLFIIFYFFAVLLSAQSVYYVAPTGGKDDNPGTIDQPWATWQKGFESARPGDTVYFRGGTYYPNSIPYSPAAVVYVNPYDDPPIGNDGTADNPICMFAYPDETPILDCRNVEVPVLFLNGISLNRVNFWHLKGLTIRKVLQSKESTCHGIVTDGISNITFENINVNNIGGKGWAIYNYFQYQAYPEQAAISGDTIRFINCDASYCMDSLGREEGRTDFGNYSDGFWLNIQSSQSYVLMDGCRSFMNSDDGFDMPTAGIIEHRNCWAFNNGHLIAGVGNGFRHDPASNTDSWIYLRCIAALNKATGFKYCKNYATMRPVSFYNNTIYANEWGVQMARNLEGTANNIFRNNIFYDNTTFDMLRSGVPETACPMQDSLHSNNFWGTKQSGIWNFTIPDHSPPVLVTDADFVSLDTSELSQSRKPDGSLPDITFLRLAEGSDLIDAGIDVGLPYRGDAPDLGAFEYESNTGVIADNRIPLEFQLNQNYPNPINPTTIISYSIPNPDFVVLKIYNILGQEVQTLVNKFQKAGDYAVDFFAQNLSGGIYFYKLQVGEKINETKKMLLIQ